MVLMAVKEKAGELAQMLKESEQYRQFQEAKAAVYANEETKRRLLEYKRKQFAVQASMMSGQTPNADMMADVQRMTMMLQYNKEIAAYLMMEHRFNQLMSEVYQTLMSSLDLEMDFLQNSAPAN